MRRYGSLDCAVLDGGEAVERLVVLCHGFGASGDDLVPIGRELHSQSAHGATRFVFPEAPLAVPGTFGGRAWWPLDAERFAVRAARGELTQLMDEEPEGLGPARRQLRACVESALTEARLGWSQLVIGGFSQGAMLTTDVALRAEEPPAALCIMSGALICRPQWTRRASRRAGLPVLMSHGLTDILLPFEAARHLRALLDEAGLQVDFRQFGGGHTIPGEVVQALSALIAKTGPIS